MPPFNVIFMGTAELACASLAALVAQPDFVVSAVVTQPDKPKGRELKLQPSPVKVVALRHQLSVLQPARARDENFLAQLRVLKPDLIVVAAYGQILPPAMLALPRFGCLNVHTSLLPKYRGAAPIQWAICDGESLTGVTIMKMDAGLDTGDILTQESTPIEPADNSQTLHDRLAILGAGLLIPTIRAHFAGKITPRPQPSEGVSYARKISREDGRLDWSQSAPTLLNRIRAFTPWPGAFTHLPAQPRPQLLKIWAAGISDLCGAPGVILRSDKSGITVACATQSLQIQVLQLEGSRRMTAPEFLTGRPLAPGQRLD